jgi:SAM-dependent methyltransferase
MQLRVSLPLLCEGFSFFRAVRRVSAERAPRQCEQSARVKRLAAEPSNKCFTARYPSGKGEVCKTFMRGFDSHPRLHSFLQVRGILREKALPVEANFLRFKPRQLDPTAWPVPIRLFLISFLSLYFELLLIRWLPTQIRILAYFNNVILISCILGMGLGVLLASRTRLFPSSFYWLLALVVGLAQLYHGGNIAIPLASEGNFIWNGLSRSAAGTPVQYVAMFLFFALNTALFIPIGQILGKEFDQMRPIPAYSVNVLGALIGMSAFALFSALRVPPVWWFLVGIILLLLLLPWTFRVGAGAVFVFALVLVGSLETSTFWSPYYRITTHPIRVGGELIGYDVKVNEDSHQQALDLSGKFEQVGDLKIRRLIYDEPYKYGSNESVLIVGAGTGNDVAAALRAGAQTVDAVEIDPVILRLGRELHLEKPYQDRRVIFWNKDARSFLRNADRQYDKIVLGYLDSHSMFSAMSSVRLDNFVYTKEFFAEMKQHLRPNGVLAVTFTVHEQWIADRLYALFEQTFHHPPLVFQGARSSSSGTVFLSGEPIRSFRPVYAEFDPTLRRTNRAYTWNYSHDTQGYISPRHFSSGVTVPDDNWPYLYLKGRDLPLNYLICMAGLFALSFSTVKFTTGLRRINLHFFFLGAAFLLVETKAMTELAIFLGSTWVVNFFVIATILALILLANLIVLKRWAPSLWILYAMLVITLIATYFLPLGLLLQWDSGLRNWIAVTILCLPLFFAGMIFAREIALEPSPSSALGSNLLGALVGGVLEYSSMMFGLKSLYLVAIVLYLLAFVFASRPHSSRAAAQGA